MVSDPVLVAPEPLAAAPAPLDPTVRAWIEAQTELLRAQTEYTRKQCAWMDTLNQVTLAMVQQPAAVRPSGKPN